MYRGEIMLGYNSADIEEMIYGLESTLLMINTDENPAIYRYLMNTVDFLSGVLAEGHVQ
jgi:hypothetical protein